MEQNTTNAPALATRPRDILTEILRNGAQRRCSRRLSRTRSRRTLRPIATGSTPTAAAWSFATATAVTNTLAAAQRTGRRSPGLISWCAHRASLKLPPMARRRDCSEEKPHRVRQRSGDKGVGACVERP